MTYSVPASLEGLDVGERVVVPLGRGDRATAGYVIEHISEADIASDLKGKIKRVSRRDGEMGVSLPPDLVKLAQWVAGYYCCPLGMVLANILPAAVKQGTGRKTRRQVRAVATPDATLIEGLTKLQRAVWDAASATRWVNERELSDRAEARTVASVRALVERGLLERRAVEGVESDLDLRAASEAGEDLPPPSLSAAQAAAVDHLKSHLRTGFRVFICCMA